MKNINFNDNWKYKRVDEKEFHSITLPHDAMIYENRNADNPSAHNSGFFAGGDYIYKKEFACPEDEEVFLHFDGVYKDAKVYINGTECGSCSYGYLPFLVYISPYLNKKQTNIVEVFVSNSQQPNSRWYTGSGIYRNVTLIQGSKDHVVPSSIKITTISISPIQIKVQFSTTTHQKAHISILDGKRILAEQDTYTFCVFDLPDAQLWSVNNPKLYECRISIGDDEECVSFGIRSLSCSAKEGFKINNEKILLKGACIHHDNGLLGACAYEEAEERKIKLLKAEGFNAIRSSHNPCSSVMLDICDRLGMLVIDEYVDMWYIHKLKFDYVEGFKKNWKSDLKTIIQRDYNHPSVIMYSIGNEVSETAKEKGVRLTQELTQYCHSLDQTRFVTCGINIFFNFLNSIGLGFYSDKKADAESKKEGKPVKKKTHHKSVGSEFFNNMTAFFGAENMKNGAKLFLSDIFTRKAFAKMDIAGYNYGIKRYKKDTRIHPDRVILGSETFASDTYQFINLAKRYPQIIGDFVWTGIDYIGEVALGSFDYEEYAPDFTKNENWISSGCGALDITGRETADGAYAKVCYGKDKIAMMVVPMNQRRNVHYPSSWRMSNARSSWSWPGCEGKTCKVEVYTLAEKVKLLLNGKAYNKPKKIKNCRFIFELIYQPGTLEAIAYDNDDNEIARCDLKSASSPTHIQLVPEEPIQKGKLSYIRVQLCDIQGIIQSTARDIISLDVKGAKLLAFSHACPYNPEGYINNKSDTYYGEALAILMVEDDVVEISATCEKYGDAKLVLKTSDIS